MSAATPRWGEPPVADVVARLLAERWGIGEPEVLTVDVDEAEGAVAAHLGAGPSRYTVRVTYRAGAGQDRDPWMLLVDALDALFGQLEESGREHRTLPSGEGVEFRGASFAVEVERSVPELQKLADRLIEEGDADR